MLASHVENTVDALGLIFDLGIQPERKDRHPRLGCHHVASFTPDRSCCDPGLHGGHPRSNRSNQRGSSDQRAWRQRVLLVIDEQDDDPVPARKRSLHFEMVIAGVRPNAAGTNSGSENKRDPERGSP